MKRAVLLTVFLMAFAHISKAQDVIHTYDSAPIQAKVLEIGDSHLQYKTWDNLDGPLYNISLTRVARIVFENGTVKTFNPASPYISPAPYDRYPLDYRWGRYYSHYNRIDPRDFSDYIGYSLYGSEYMKANSQYTWGFYLTCVGAGGMILSVASHLAHMRLDEMASRHGMTSIGSGAGIAAGYIFSAGCLGAGIPLWVKGNRGLRKIADDYNKTYINPENNGHSSNLSLGATGNGLGLAFNF